MFSFDVPAIFVGTPGTVDGVEASLGEEAILLPLAFRAVTVNV